jgi:hypothetical protein
VLSLLGMMLIIAALAEPAKPIAAASVNNVLKFMFFSI